MIIVVVPHVAILFRDPCEDLMKDIDPVFQKSYNTYVVSATSQTFSLGTQALDYAEFLSALRI